MRSKFIHILLLPYSTTLYEAGCFNHQRLIWTRTVLRRFAPPEVGIFPVLT
jgi:hypothetical protein